MRKESRTLTRSDFEEKLLIDLSQSKDFVCISVPFIDAAPGLYEGE